MSGRSKIPLMAIIAGWLVLCGAYLSIQYSRPTGGEPVVVENGRLSVVWVPSSALEKSMRVIVYLPVDYVTGKRYPVLYLLHGYANIEDNWFTKVGIDVACNKLVAAGKIGPLILVAPEIDNSFGINSSDNTTTVGKRDDIKNNQARGRYEDWLAVDLIRYIDAH